MIKALQIQGFQSHSDSTIEFDRNVTAIIGLNNHGKSSILKALRKAVRNVPEGRSFITSTPLELPVSSITTHTEQANVVQRVGRGTSPKDNMYIVESGESKLEFTKFGRTIPDEVVAAFGFSPIQEFGNIEFDLNFQIQGDDAFLVKGDSLSSVRSKVISKITGVDKIQRAIQLGRLKEGAFTKELSSLQSRRQDLLIELEQFKDLDIQLQTVDLIESKLDEVNNLSYLIDDYKESLQGLEEVLREAKQVKHKLNHLSTIPSTDHILNLESSVKILRSLEQVEVEIRDKKKFVSIEVKSDLELVKSLKVTIEICKDLLTLCNRESVLTDVIELSIPNVSTLTEKVNHLEYIKNSHSSVLAILEGAKRLKTLIENTDKELQEVEIELYNYKKEIGVCPTCQQPFKV